MKNVKALKDFYGTFDEKMKLTGEEFVVSNNRALELEKFGLAEVLGDSTETPAEEPIIDPNQTTPILEIDPIVNRDDIEQKTPIGGNEDAEGSEGNAPAEEELPNIAVSPDDEAAAKEEKNTAQTKELKTQTTTKNATSTRK